MKMNERKNDMKYTEHFPDTAVQVSNGLLETSASASSIAYDRKPLMI